MTNPVKELTNQEIKEHMFLMAPKKLAAAEQTVYGWLFEELESRLSDEDFDSFLDQVDSQILKAAA